MFYRVAVADSVFNITDVQWQTTSEHLNKVNMFLIYETLPQESHYHPSVSCRWEIIVTGGQDESDHGPERDRK